MSLSGLTTFLLILGVIVTSTYAQTCPDFINITANASYTLNVSPTALTNATIYTATLNFTQANATGTNVTVLFKVASNNTNIGNWTLPNGFTICNDGITGNYLNNASLSANWTSPQQLNVTSVLFSVFINSTFGNASYKAETNVSVAATNTTTTTTTTIAPTTVNTTKITNGGQKQQSASMFLALIESLTLLVITSKLLS